MYVFTKPVSSTIANHLPILYATNPMNTHALTIECLFRTTCMKHFRVNKNYNMLLTTLVILNNKGRRQSHKAKSTINKRFKGLQGKVHNHLNASNNNEIDINAATKFMSGHT